MGWYGVEQLRTKIPDGVAKQNAKRLHGAVPSRMHSPCVNQVSPTIHVFKNDVNTDGEEEEEQQGRKER